MNWKERTVNLNCCWRVGGEARWLQDFDSFTLFLPLLTNGLGAEDFDHEGEKSARRQKTNTNDDNIEANS